MFHYGLFTIRELEFFSGMVGIEVLSSSKLFHSDHQASMLHTATIRQAKSSKQNGLAWIPAHSLEFELFPVFCLGPNMKGLDNFPAELSEGRWQNAVG